MSDWVDEKAKELLQAPGSCPTSSLDNLVHDIATALREAAKPKWKPINQMPKVGRYLIVATGKHCNNHMLVIPGDAAYGPGYTHYMTLPDPPKESGE